MRTFALCAIQAALMIIGCAGPMPSVSLSPPPPATTAFDGSYRSTIKVIPTPSVPQGVNWCVTKGQPVITVRDGQFSYSIPHAQIASGGVTPESLTTAEIMATIRPDGLFLGESSEGTMSGRFYGHRFEGIIEGMLCRFAITGYRL